MLNASFFNRRADSLGISATGFRQRFLQYLNPRRLGAQLRQERKRKQRTDTKISSAGLIMGRVYHFMQASGTAATHVRQMSGRKISESQVSRRCRAMGVKIFEWVMGEILGPRADPRREPEAFYRGMRLTGLDGTMFSMFNTPSVLKALSKAVSRRMKAAFAKLGVVSLVELGTHRPMAAVIAHQQESEFTLAMRLVGQVPVGCLLLADRLYGVGKFLVAFLKLFVDGQSDFLIRVRKGQFNRRRIKKNRDRSVLWEIWGTDPEGGKQLFLAREIRGVVIGRGGHRTSLRLWTSLLDCELYPAQELIKLYLQRWEHEISFKELKIHLHGNAPLQSYTPETGCQEIASLLIAQALLADLRLEASRRGEIPVLRVSFMKVLHHVSTLWEVFSWAGEGFTEKQRCAAIRGMFRSLLRQLSPPRRARSCPRVVRQPIGPWPRKLKNGGDSHGDFHYEISRIIRK